MITKQILEHLIRHKFPTQLAVTSFIIGTLLFLGFIIFPKEEAFIYVGMIYILIAFVVNSCTFLFLVYQYFMEPDEKLYHQFQIIIMLSNIPISILYFYLLISFI